MLKGEYSYDQLTYVYNKSIIGFSDPLRFLNVGQRLLLAPPRDEPRFMSFAASDYVGVSELSSLYWFSSDTKRSRRFLIAMGFKCYNREQALKYAHEYFSRRNVSFPISHLDIYIRSDRHRWLLTGYCKNIFGCPQRVREQCKAFGKFDGGISHSCGTPKLTLWERFWGWLTH